MKGDYNMLRNSGWMVKWEIGRVIERKNKNGKVAYTIIEKDSFCTTDKEEAEKKKTEKEKEGYKNVAIYEAIF